MTSYHALKKLCSMKIRDFKKDDFDQLMQLWEATGLSNPARGDNQMVIERTILAGGKLIILEHEEKIIGSSWITNDNRRLYLHHFGILPQWQGKGLSKLLLDASLKFARSKKLQLKLEVHRDNNIAIQLYKNQGFRYLGDYDVYIIRSYNDF